MGHAGCCDSGVHCLVLGLYCTSCLTSSATSFGDNECTSHGCRGCLHSSCCPSVATHLWCVSCQCDRAWPEWPWPGSSKKKGSGKPEFEDVRDKSSFWSSKGIMDSVP